MTTSTAGQDLESLIAIVQRQEATIGMLEERDKQNEKVFAGLKSDVAALNEKLASALAADSEISILKGKNDALTQLLILKSKTVSTEQQQQPSPTIVVDAGHQNSTHNPLLNKDEKLRMKSGVNTIIPGSFKSEMLGTACNLGRGDVPQPAGCFDLMELNQPCKTASGAARGTCTLRTVSVPQDSPFGGKSGEFSIFRGLDPGTQVKLHLHRVRTYWTVYGTRVMSKFPQDHQKLVAKVAAASSTTRLSRELISAFKHYYYAISILMHYNPSKEDYDMLVASDGIPYGAMSFFTPPEMSSITEFFRIVAETDPAILQRVPKDTIGKADVAIYTDVIGSMYSEMATPVIIEGYYRAVISDLEGSRAITRKFLLDISNTWTKLPNYQQIQESDTAREIIEEGGKGNLEALRSI